MTSDALVPIVLRRPQATCRSYAGFDSWYPILRSAGDLGTYHHLNVEQDDVGETRSSPVPALDDEACEPGPIRDQVRDSFSHDIYEGVTQTRGSSRWTVLEQVFRRGQNFIHSLPARIGNGELSRQVRIGSHKADDITNELKVSRMSLPVRFAAYILYMQWQRAESERHRAEENGQWAIAGEREAQRQRDAAAAARLPTRSPVCCWVERPKKSGASRSRPMALCWPPAAEQQGAENFCCGTSRTEVCAPD